MRVVRSTRSPLSRPSVSSSYMAAFSFPPPPPSTPPPLPPPPPPPPPPLPPPPPPPPPPPSPTWEEMNTRRIERKKERRKRRKKAGQAALRPPRHFTFSVSDIVKSIERSRTKEAARLRTMTMVMAEKRIDGPTLTPIPAPVPSTAEGPCMRRDVSDGAVAAPSVSRACPAAPASSVSFPLAVTQVSSVSAPVVAPVAAPVSSTFVTPPRMPRLLLPIDEFIASTSSVPIAAPFLLASPIEEGSEEGEEEEKQEIQESTSSMLAAPRRESSVPDVRVGEGKDEKDDRVQEDEEDENNDVSDDEKDIIAKQGAEQPKDLGMKYPCKDTVGQEEEEEEEEEEEHPVDYDSSPAFARYRVFHPPLVAVV